MVLQAMQAQKNSLLVHSESHAMPSRADHEVQDSKQTCGSKIELDKVAAFMFKYGGKYSGFSSTRRPWCNLESRKAPQ